MVRHWWDALATISIIVSLVVLGTPLGPGPHLIANPQLGLVLPEEGDLFRFQIHLSSQQVCGMCILTLEMMREK